MPEPEDATQTDAEEPKEGLDLRDTGNIHLWVEGKQYKLRRVRGREFRRLREAWHEMLDGLTVSQAENQAWLADIQEKAVTRASEGQPLMTDDERVENVRRGREQQAEADRAVIGWWIEVVEVLGTDNALDKLIGPKDDEGNRPPDAWEDMPPWLSSIATGTKVLEHWRSVPSLSGVR